MEEVRIQMNGGIKVEKIHNEKILEKHKMQYLKELRNIEEKSKNIGGLADVALLQWEYIKKFSTVKEPENLPSDEADKIWEPIMRRLIPGAAMNFTKGSQSSQQQMKST